MKPYKLLFILCAFLIGCGGGIQSEFPLEKRHWNVEDYDNAIRTILYVLPKEQNYPEFENPETAPIIKKLTDKQNFLVVLTDDQLGLTHRSKVASDFFAEYRQLSDGYYVTDRQDKFVYGMELIEIMKFGLELQLHYFKLGNDKIVNEADNPNSAKIKRVVSSNETTVFQNFNHYLDLVNKSNGFSEKELKAYSEGIDTYFTKLFKTFPNGNGNIIENKAKLMLKKAENKDVTESLEKLLNHISTLNQGKS